MHWRLVSLYVFTKLYDDYRVAVKSELRSSLTVLPALAVGCAVLSRHLAGADQILVAFFAAALLAIVLNVVVGSYGATDISPDQQLRSLLQSAMRESRVDAKSEPNLFL